MKCCECKFYLTRRKDGMPAEECHRYPPLDVQWLDYHSADLLRDIAWSLNKIAGISIPESPSIPINSEATEVPRLKWPYVDENDWCGEFQQK